MYGSCLLRAIGTTFPIETTKTALSNIPQNYQKIIRNVFEAVLTQMTKLSEKDWANLPHTVSASLRPAIPPPQSTPTLHQFLLTVQNHTHPLTEQYEPFLLKTEYQINHTLTPLNTPQSQQFAHLTRQRGSNNSQSSTSSLGDLIEERYKSIYDDLSRTLSIPFLLVGPNKISTSSYHNDQSLSRHPSISSQGSVFDRSFQQFNSSLNNLSTMSSSNDTNNNTAPHTQSKANLSFDNFSNSSSPRNQTHLDHTLHSASQPTSTALIGAFHPLHNPHIPTLSDSRFTQLDHHANAIIQTYQQFKSNPQSLTVNSFNEMIKYSQLITTGMFELSTTQLTLFNQLKDDSDKQTKRRSRDQAQIGTVTRAMSKKQRTSSDR
jgi:hypothetical protein